MIKTDTYDHFTADEFKLAWNYVRLTHDVYFTDYQKYKNIKQAFIERHGKLNPYAIIYAETCYIERSKETLPTAYRMTVYGYNAERSPSANWLLLIRQFKRILTEIYGNDTILYMNGDK